MITKENEKTISKIREIDLKNVNNENLTYLLAVVRSAKISNPQNEKKPLPYAMKDFSEFIKKHNISLEEMLHNFGFFLEKSQDKAIKDLLKELIVDRCSFYQVMCINKQTLGTCNAYYVKINLPLPNNIVKHVLDEVKNIKQSKDCNDYYKPYTMVRHTFDDGIEIVKEGQ